MVWPIQYNHSYKTVKDCVNSKGFMPTMLENDGWIWTERDNPHPFVIGWWRWGN